MKIFKPSTLVSLGIAIAAALVTQPVRATAIPPSLVITETSSTTLTAMLTVNGTTTSLGVSDSVDSWTIALANVGGTSGSTETIRNWLEPDAAGFVNEVFFDPRSLDQLSVNSDFAHATGLADDTTDQTSFTLNGVALWVTFDDDGDVAAVPDTGSTLGLLSLSVVALLGATRLRSLKLA
jgi:hypothetical protein